MEKQAIDYSVSVPESVFKLEFKLSFWKAIQFSWNILVLSKAHEVSAKKKCITRKADYDDEDYQKLPQETYIVSENPEPKLLTQKPCPVDDVNDEGVTLGEVSTVMGKLGAAYDPSGDKLQEKMVPKDIVSLFEEQEPSIQEVKAAFAMFDENNDGFIEAAELKKVLSTLCLREVSEADCKNMISAKDENGDGLIDFYEFVRLLADSFAT